jgi:hypothetical protein
MIFGVNLIETGLPSRYGDLYPKQSMTVEVNDVNKRMSVIYWCHLSLMKAFVSSKAIDIHLQTVSSRTRPKKNPQTSPCVGSSAHTRPKTISVSSSIRH